ncbi:unnamed protein product, partial [Porites lobata]
SAAYLPSCDLLNTPYFTVPSLPFLSIDGLFTHFSFIDFPSERQMCILPLSRSQVNLVIIVESSTLVKICFFGPESDEHSMLLIWDFAVDQTQTAAAEAPKVPTRETLPAAPLLDV